MTTVRQALNLAISELNAAGIASPEVDARELAAKVLGIPPLQVGLAGRREMPPEFQALLKWRLKREPLQYILQEAYFGSRRLVVGPGVFIPRPETEVLAQWAVEKLRSTKKSFPLVVDLCTGSGALAGYIAEAYPQAKVVAVEISAPAASYAQQNFADLKNIELRLGDATDLELLKDLQGQVDLVVTNPPYVPETTELQPEVYADPHNAVFAGPDGMSLINDLVEPIFQLLVPGGAFGMEHDDSTAASVKALISKHPGFAHITPLKDLTGRTRFITASKLENL
ncbi:peptide chain release factor N(5)-glutamine methyltransferase [Corynebacterium caspium]|uniref:peptide chain release factor N(5)-glutamine methyltransferase n=1 Tax=Corynebacterium caspium TaxID=234828 RepID=UPI00037291D4|nr:peptide chain release factor N(5)-glutamine methyltransferase [Corynebacterium caspium]WKD59456.1 Release factor glutamine methyltransferase [Corynebacterium caspium DSM 44850]